jgi:hypothetical protein
MSIPDLTTGKEVINDPAAEVAGKERGISPAGVAERPRRGWVQPGEFAGAKVKLCQRKFPHDPAGENAAVRA